MLTDLTRISADVDRCLTDVDITFLGTFKRQPWLKAGRAKLQKHRLGWELSAYLDNAYDFEHDPAYAFRLPLIGLELESAEVFNHVWNYEAYVAPAPDSFHVPLPGYDPLEAATPCPTCKAKGEEHLIVEEGHYIPPFEQVLYEKVRCQRVHLTMGVRWKIE